MTSTKTQTGLRRYTNWVEAFTDATAETSTPELFRRWSAISALAGTLERRVWVKTMGSLLYPNLYIVLVARPGVGKTEVTDRVRLMWEEIQGMHVASSNLSRASLADELNDAKVMAPGTEFNALSISVNELGTLIPKYSPDFMAQLTDLYDCKSYTERKRGNKLTIKLEAPFLNMLAATQPATLHSMLPENAWDQGFMSRCILIFSGQRILKELFEVPAVKLDDLSKDLHVIRRMRGKFEFTEEAKALINQWHMNGGEPRPAHPKLTNYCERRTAHVLKLCQVASANESNTLEITLENVQQALDWVLEAESEMEDIFKAMTSGGDSSLISDTFHWMRVLHVKHNKKPIARTRIVAFLTERTDAYKVKHIIDMMEQSGMIELKMVDGKTAYIPKPRGSQYE